MIGKTLGFLVMVASLIAAAWLGMLTLGQLDRRPRTDDAYIDADVVHMAPDVGGRVEELRVRENQEVHRGDVLMVIDQEPYALKVAQSRAQVEAVAASLEEMARTVASQASRADASASGVLSAETTLAEATATLARVQPLLQHGYVSAQQVDQARTAQRTAQVSLIQSRQQARSAREEIRSTRPLEAQLAEARALLALAERDLRKTVVPAPCDGRVTGLSIAAGEYASTGRPLFTIIDTERWYVVANFREIDLVGLARQQHVTVFAMAAPGRPFGGHIEGLGFGVSPDEGRTSNGLPAVPRSLNWVRIAQRFPVRIHLDDPPVDLARIGASAVVVIDR